MEKALRKYGALFLLPTAIAFLIAFAVPFVMGVGLSFTKFTTVTDAEWVGLNNYITAFTSNGEFIDALWFTVKFTVVSVVTINVFAFALATLLTKSPGALLLALLINQELKGTRFFRTVFFMPNLIGGIVLGYIWQMILNGILAAWGVTLTYKAEYGFWGLVILTNWQLIGYMMVIYIAAISNIPGDLIDAARVDGANRRQLRHVTIPMVMSAITICTFLTLTNSFKMFDQNLALTAGAPGRSTSMLALDIYNTFYGRTGFEGVGQAKAVIFFLVVGLIALLQLYFTRRREVEQ